VSNYAPHLIVAAVVALVGCSGGEPSDPVANGGESAEAAARPADQATGSGDVTEVPPGQTGDLLADQTDQGVERLFVYETDLDPPPCATSPEPRRMRVRGYGLVFAGSADTGGGSTATLLLIVSDATVPGIVYEVDAACLSALDEVHGPRGYQRARIHVEEMTDDLGSESVPATTYQLPMGVAYDPSAPSAEYVTRLRAAWDGKNIDTACIDHALANP